MFKLSIVIPSYNRYSTFKLALNDCLNQTLRPYEIIVCDDGSGLSELKKIETLIKEVKKKNNQVIFLKNKKNLGLIPTVNNLIKKTKGDYLAIVHNDDRLSPYFVEEFKNIITSNKEFNVYTTNAMGFLSNGKVCGDFRLKRESAIIKKEIGFKELINRGFYSLITITGPTVYKIRFIKNRLFCEKYGNEADLEMALYLLFNQDIYFSTKPLYYTGLHQSQLSTTNKNTKESLCFYIRNCLKIYRKYFNFNNNFFYQKRIFSLFFYQLKFKYYLSFKEIRDLMKITILDVFFAYLLIPFFIIPEASKRINFVFFKKEYKVYFPEELF